MGASRPRLSGSLLYGRRVRAAIALGVALPLATADLVLKGVLSTPAWAWHQRSVAWLVLCVAVLALLLVLLRVPSAAVPPAAGILAAGVLGNALSAAWNDLEVPNPLVLRGDEAVIAFNLADVWVLGGLVALFSALGVWIVRNRAALPQRRRGRAS